METISKVNDPIQFVEDLELAMPNAAFEVAMERGATTEDLIAEKGEQAFIADKSLVSFVSDLNGQNRKDVLNSTLLAQLAANKKAAIETDMEAWYKSFVEVLKQLGWVIEEQRTDSFESKHKLFEVEEVIVDILTGAFGMHYIQLIKNTLAALKKMSDTKDGKIKIFERNTQAHNKGCFQVGVAAVENDSVTMQMGTFMLSANSEMKRILFIKFNKDMTTLRYASCRATLSADAYGKVREKVAQRLENFMTDFVAEIEL